MYVTVYCGARFGAKEEYSKAAKDLGTWIGENGHVLVFGGSNEGLMKLVCESALDAGAKVIGVEPDTEFIRKVVHPRLSEVIYTNSFAERRSYMMGLGNVFIALPGGFGTYDEITEALEMKIIGNHNSPVIFFNAAGYYEKLKDFFDFTVEQGFARDEEKMRGIQFIDTMEEIAQVIEAEEKRLAEIEGK